jgi:hypothetical protein
LPVGIVKLTGEAGGSGGSFVPVSQPARARPRTKIVNRDRRIAGSSLEKAVMFFTLCAGRHPHVKPGA